MEAGKRGSENTEVPPPITDKDTLPKSKPGSVKGKDLVGHIFSDPEALRMLQDAILSKVPKSPITGALKAPLKASDIRPPATKRPRGAENYSIEMEDEYPEQGIQDNDNPFPHDTSGEDEEDLNQSASRWQASESLASFLGTMHKPLTVFERKAICRKYPRPDVEAVYTPNLDAYLSSLVPGVKAVDKERKFVQDRLLDAMGPTGVLFEHIYGTLSDMSPDEEISLSYEQMNEMGAMVSNTIRLIGNASALLSKDRRTAVLQKINSKGTLTSLAAEEFPEAGKNLFGEGFAARIKTRSEIAQTLLQASSVGSKPTQFFRGRTTPFRRRGSHWGGASRGHSYFNNQTRSSFRGRGRGSRGFHPQTSTQTTPQ